MAAPDDPPERHPEASPAAVPPRVVAAGYLIALLCALVPLAAVGGVFAGVALLRRGRPRDGALILGLTAACTAIGVVLLFGA